LGSPAVEDAAERCEGAIEGVSVGVALYVDILVEARLPVDCGFFALGDVWAADDMVGGGVSDWRRKREGKRKDVGLQTPRQVLGG
jgi:hypothetical protein